MPASKKTNSYDRAVAARIRALRLARGMSQAELGGRIGVTFQQVQKYETGVNRIGAGRLQRIAEIFDVPLAALFEAPGLRRKGGADPLEALGTAGAARLVEAYSRIRDAMVRRAFVRLAEQMASRES
jgi:transcriptional regulator with XRE-family HTH domain